MERYDICIVGAGAAGLAAAVTLANTKHSVLIFDQNKKSGTKLYATGNGRCNLGNQVIASRYYYENRFACQVVNKESSDMLFRWFSSLGVPVISRNGYLYPHSNQASSVVWALNEAVRAGKNIETVYKETVIQIEHREDSGTYYVIETESGHRYEAVRVILCMGGVSQEKLGAARECNTRRIAKGLKLPLSELRPALCPVETEEDVASVMGVRAGCRITHDTSGLTEEGELQFTEYGLSGIAVFNLSTIVKEGDGLTVNLLPDRSEDDFTALAKLVREQNPKKRFLSFLNGFLNDKLCTYVLRSNQDFQPMEEALMQDMTEERCILLYRMLTQLHFNVKGLRGFDQAQITKGGLITKVVDPGSMRIEGYTGLYAAGEFLDVQGMCGGYNLMFSFLTGIKAAKDCLEERI